MQIGWVSTKVILPVILSFNGCIVHKWWPPSNCHANARFGKLYTERNVHLPSVCYNNDNNKEVYVMVSETCWLCLEANVIGEMCTSYNDSMNEDIYHSWLWKWSVHQRNEWGNVHQRRPILNGKMLTIVGLLNGKMFTNRLDGEMYISFEISAPFCIIFMSWPTRLWWVHSEKVRQWEIGLATLPRMPRLRKDTASTSYPWLSLGGQLRRDCSSSANAEEETTLGPSQTKLTTSTNICA